MIIIFIGFNRDVYEHQSGNHGTGSNQSHRQTTQDRLCFNDCFNTHIGTHKFPWLTNNGGLRDVQVYNNGKWVTMNHNDWADHCTHVSHDPNNNKLYAAHMNWISRRPKKFIFKDGTEMQVYPTNKPSFESFFRNENAYFMNNHYCT
jgi:hypothetical protein